MVNATFIISGVIIQTIFLLSIFNIYFTSPIIRGIPAVPNDQPFISSRVVFISVDGLREDALFNESIALFLKNKLKTGAYGTSNCRLPTESRPGHVALLAGFYEDPSAVTKGWKENPVDFDSIFNRSICSFSWGSPDIVNIFYKELNHPCIYRETYKDGQDFSGDTQKLDTWVLEHLNKFFKTQKEALYNTNQSFYFLHLLGQDTSGHTHKPKTPKYRANLKNVDEIVSQVEKLFDKTFPDLLTSFILTADHGMTDWGSHGSGDPSETKTPFLAWGNGIKYGQIQDIEQADIVPLIAVLLGISIPVNSVGILPLDVLNISPKDVTKAYLLNARQIAQQYKIKKKEYEDRIFVKHLNLPLDQFINRSFSEITKGNLVEAQNLTKAVIKMSLRGIWYYQNYYQTVLFVVMVFNFILWICLLIVELNNIPVNQCKSKRIYFIAALSVNILVRIEGLHWLYNVYFTLPVYLLWTLGNRLRFVLISGMKNWPCIIFLIIGLEHLVYGFFHRAVFILPIFYILIWPFGFLNITQSNLKLIGIWIISNVTLCFFPLLPVIGNEPNPNICLFSGTLLTILTLLYHVDVNNRKTHFRVACVALATVISYQTHQHFKFTGVVIYTKHFTSWCLLLVAFSFLYEPTSDIWSRLKSIFVTLSIPLILLSITHEVLFLLTFFISLLCWVKFELMASRKIESNVSFRHFRQAFFFMTYIYVAFFGIGNTSSLNSFDISWVRCFVTTFSPYLMSALILLKTVIPFLIVSVCLRAITLFLNQPSDKIFLIVLLFSNWMGLNFLFLVKNTGSWLDIGLSISHFVIQQVTIVFLLLLHFASIFLLGVPDKENIV